MSADRQLFEDGLDMHHTRSERQEHGEGTNALVKGRSRRDRPGYIDRKLIWLDRAFSRLTARVSNRLLGENSQRCVRHLPVGIDGAAPDPRLLSLCGAGAGKKCVIVGTGPSAKTVDLKIAGNCHVMALNRAREISALLGRTVDSLIMSDPSAMAEYGRASAATANMVLLDRDAAESASLMLPDALLFRQFQFPRMDDGLFQLNLERPLYQSRTVAHPALQIAVWMAFDEIAFLGVDFAFDHNEPHFYKTCGAELDRSRTISVSKSGMMINGLLEAKRILERRGVKVFNAGDEGGNNPFPYVSLSDFCANT